MKTIRAADLFCGAGGTSTGLAQACERAGARLELTAINHWSVAVETHSRNHPGARHRCATLDSVNPRTLFPRGLDLLMASPECTHHSAARGGAPINDQSRASAWHVVHWAEALRPAEILVENVPAFRKWGPLGVNGKALKSRQGETYQAFLTALRSLGYTVQDRLLVSADYGDPTTRERVFVRARLGKRAPAWPLASHASAGEAPLLQLPRWRPAREIIDWSLKGSSIFGRKKPLAPKTLARIEDGLRRFGGKHAEPFLVLLRGTGRSRSLDRPLPSLTAGGEHVGVVTPFLLSQGAGGVARPVSQPAPTLVTGCAISLVEPFIVPYYGTGVPHRIDVPLHTVTTHDRYALAHPTAQLDILFRMLAPHEAAAAMGFPPGYDFAGNRTEIMRQIGNAVSVGEADALCSSAIGVAA